MTKQAPIRTRSWLFTPATRPERFAKASQAGADVAILDLEDAVAPGDKARARTTALDYLAENPSDSALHALRINGLDTRAGGRPSLEPCLYVLGSRSLRIPADAALHRDQPDCVQRQSRDVGRTVKRGRHTMNAEQVKRSLPALVTSADFRKRAQHYRLASALTDVPRDAAMFDEIASMFDQIACRFGRAETRLARLQSSTPAAATASPVGAIAR
jgi:hypothetical protein